MFGYVLAGGASSRFGRDKALAEVSGRTMLEHVCALLESVVGRVAVVGPPQRYAHLGIRVVPDHWPGSGPLGGIATALLDAAKQDARCTWCMIAGCDLPFLRRDWLEYLVTRARRSKADAVMPVSPRGAEPLCAAYRTSAASLLAQELDRGVRKITDALAGARVETIGLEEWKPFDPDGRLLKNMNTMEDYEDVRAAWATRVR
jgi:molybdopterin-guanine dinucleotide biosynthesis protein A